MSTEKIKLGSSAAYTIGWISALFIERAAAEALLDKEHDAPDNFQQHESDLNSYSWGQMGKHNIVIASLPAGVYGTVSAATVVSSLLASLPHIKIGLLVGIGGGTGSYENPDIRLGDVVVSLPSNDNGGVVQYDLGKATVDPSRERQGTFERKGFLNAPPLVLLNALAKLRAEHERRDSKIPALLTEMLKNNPKMRQSKKGEPAYIHQGFENDRLFQPDYVHAGGTTCTGCSTSNKIKRDNRDDTDPEIHYGIIASGDTLIKNAWLRDSIAEDVGLDCVCVEMEAAGLMNRFPCLVIRGICDYADSHKNDRWQKYASATAAAFGKELLDYVKVQALEETPPVYKLIESQKDIKEGLKGQRTLKRKIQDVHDTIEDVDTRSIFKSLPVADQASFDSFDESENSGCLENTRVQLLDDIFEWIAQPSSETIFWLCGLAGTGKSTVSHSVCRRLGQSLGANFFFKRGEGDRASSQKLFTTLARQLVTRRPSLAPYIRHAIDRDSSVGGKGIMEQFQRLILEPLLQLSSESATEEAGVIIIDALDECEEAHNPGIRGARSIIGLLGRLQATRWKVFVTSRPELVPTLGFKDLKGNYQGIRLHDIPKRIVRPDITLFLENELSRIREDHNSTAVTVANQLESTWPATEIPGLVDIAMPLFISAATICRFINDRAFGGPREGLKTVLDQRGVQLDKTYLPVLNRIFGEGLKDESKPQKAFDQFQMVVGSIILLASPLSMQSLAKLLGTSASDIENGLQKFHSVLNVPSDGTQPVRLFHLSFRDFLVDPQWKTRPFWIDQRQTHERLASQCLQFLSSGNILKRNICDLRDPGIARVDIPQDVLESKIPPDVRYACQYWAYHLKESNYMIKDNDKVHCFLTKYFLCWVEVLGHLGRVNDIFTILDDLIASVQPENDSQILLFLQDAQRVIFSHGSTVDAAPLQIHYSAMIFAPEQSILRQMFHPEVSSLFSPLPQVARSWDAHLATFEGHDDLVTSIAVSPDSKVLATAALDCTLKLWDAVSGICLATLASQLSGPEVPVYDDYCSLLSFSHDSTKLIHVYYKARLWDISTGECVILSYPTKALTAIFISNSTKLISAHIDGTIRTYGAGMEEKVLALEESPESPKKAVFSNNATLLAIGSAYGVLKVWDVISGKCISIFQDQDINLLQLHPKNSEAEIISLVFSPDSERLATSQIFPLGLIKFWEATSGKLLACYLGHTECIRSLAFSSDNNQLASASDDRTAMIWDMATGNCTSIFDCPTTVESLVFFGKNPQRVAGACFSGSINIFEAEPQLDTKETVKITDTSKQNTKFISLSPDLQTLVTVAFRSNNLQLWDIITGQRIRRLTAKDTVNSVSFSHDSKMLASSSEDEIRLWAVTTGKCIRDLQDEKCQTVISVLFSNDSRILASATFTQISLWNPISGELIWTFEQSFPPLESDDIFHLNILAFSTDTSRIAIAWVQARKFQVLAVASGECLAAISMEMVSEFRFQALAFLTDSTKLFLASSSSDELRPATTISLWDIESEIALTTIEDENYGILGFARTNNFFEYARNRSFLISDRTCTISLPPLYSQGMGISPDGKCITWGLKPILWLPPAFRAEFYVRTESTIAFISASQELVILGLAHAAC